jgi:hypothetical protein
MIKNELGGLVPSQSRRGLRRDFCRRAAVRGETAAKPIRSAIMEIFNTRYKVFIFFTLLNIDFYRLG